MLSLVPGVLHHFVCVCIGVGEYQALTCSCRTLHYLLSSFREKYKINLTRQIEACLGRWLGIDISLVREMSQIGIFSGSAVLSAANHEPWKPNDVDFWRQELPHTQRRPTTRLLQHAFHLSTILPEDSQEYQGMKPLQYEWSYRCAPLKSDCLSLNVLLCVPVHPPSANFPPEPLLGKHIVETFDARFLQNYYTQEKLFVGHLKSVMERRSSELTKNFLFEHAPNRRIDRIAKYAKRHFWIE
jgi:hypothetical protein